MIAPQEDEGRSVRGGVMPLVAGNYPSRGPPNPSPGPRPWEWPPKGTERHPQETILSYDFYTRRF